MSPQKTVEYFCSNRFKTDLSHPNNRYYLRVTDISPGKLTGMLKAAIGQIDDCAKRLTAFSTLDSDKYFHLYREGVTLRDHAMPSHFTVAIASDLQVDAEYSDHHLAFLESVNAKNRTALNKVLKGEPIFDTRLALLEPVVGGHVPSSNRTNIAAFYMVDMVEASRCSRCKKPKERDYMSKHVLHPECDVETNKLRMREQGLVKIEDINDAIAVRQAGVIHEMVSEFYAVYAPAWVVDAIKIYSQNENYAGMQLDEFLRSMKPDAKR